jgi:hypothetical protein
MNECSVCFKSPFTQNDYFTCSHPLCECCLFQLKVRCCPLCRSYDNKYIEINLTKDTFNIPAIYLNYFVFGYSYTQYLKVFIVNRRKNNVLIRVNQYLKNHSFIIHRKQYLPIGDYSMNNLINLILYHKLTITNKRIILYAISGE